jgi:hypothetical protein
MSIDRISFILMTFIILLTQFLCIHLIKVWFRGVSMLYFLMLDIFLELKNGQYFKGYFWMYFFRFHLIMIKLEENMNLQCLFSVCTDL